MLTHLQLKDFVIVDEAALDFGPGLTALTGETGAGKSIVVDALLLIAGGRGGADVVRHGAERADVAASFSDLPPAALEWLDAQSIDRDGEVVVRRVVGADGRSRAYVNGQLLPLQQLREFADFFMEIHGQQEFQHLVKRDAQRAMLDQHLGDAGRTLAAAVSALSTAARQCRREYDALKSAADNRGARLDLLRYQRQELQGAVTTPAAIEELFIEQKRLAGRGRLCAAAQGALAAVYDADSGSAHDVLAKAAAALRAVGDSDPALAAPAGLLTEATVLAREAAETLRRYLDGLEVDPARQDEIERQAATLENLARKHRVNVLELPAQLTATEQEIQQLDNAEHNLAELEQRLGRVAADYRVDALRLTEARRGAAVALGGQITDLMQSLGMVGGRFAVDIRPGEAEFAAHGMDEVEFLVSANPGQPLKSLAKVASGGELSRISLAVQVAAAAGAAALCMVFDEVDSGIGGGIAEIVGRQLRELGSRTQVLCVTHLAQVASQAHTQFRVVKQTDGRATRTAVKTLTGAERVDEIARMLGGIDITDQARAHAQEMLSRVAAEPAAPRVEPAASEFKKRRAKSARD